MIEILHLTLDHPRYDDLTAQLLAEPLATEWWADAESKHEDGIEYVMVLADGVPAAWAGWRIEVDTDAFRRVLRCRNSYERRGPGRELGLYAHAYRERHERVVLTSGLPGLTYLYAEPIPLHEADGWVKTGVCGVSKVPGLKPHPWWELRRPA